MMKVRRLDAPKKATPSKYPYLGVYKFNSDVIVLFTAPKTGTAVCECGSVGDTSHTWAESDFTHYSGEICLSNDSDE